MHLINNIFQTLPAGEPATLLDVCLWRQKGFGSYAQMATMLFILSLLYSPVSHAPFHLIIPPLVY